jgi:NitT/TauT family transport system substrate-binding protein
MRTTDWLRPGAFCRRLAVLAIALLLTGCGEVTKPVPLRIGTNVWPGYEPLFLARDLGLLDPKRVQMIEYVSASQAMRAFRSGAVDAGTLTLDEVLRAHQEGVGQSIVLVMDYSSGADVVIGRKGLSDIRELKGLRIGFEKSALGAYVLSRVLELAELKIDDVQTVNLELNEHERALKGGEVDAVVTFEPRRSRLVAEGYPVIFDSTRIPGEIVDTLSVQTGYAARHPRDIRYVIEAWYGALDYMQQHPEDAMRRMSKRLGLAPEQTREVFNGVHILGHAENLKALTGPSPTLMPLIERLSGVMKDYGLIKAQVTGQHLLDADLLTRLYTRD